MSSPCPNPLTEIRRSNFHRSISVWGLGPQTEERFFSEKSLRYTEKSLFSVYGRIPHSEILRCKLILQISVSG